MRLSRTWTSLSVVLLVLLGGQVARADGSTAASHVSALILSSPPGPQDESESNRRAGECEKVARAIHLGLREFAQKPVFIRFSVDGQYKNLGFDVMENGVMVKNLQISQTGHHVAVKLGDKVIDAYTGLTGLPLRDYLARLSTDTKSHVVHEVVEQL
jgi:hypothetical protein